jgi:beta-hydroxylase
LVSALCVLLVHLRGRVRLRFDRQLVDHSAIFAPYNLLMYAFSAVPARPILDRRGFPAARSAAGELAGHPRRGDAPVRRGLYPRRGKEQRRQLQQFLQAGLEAFLPEVVRRAAGLGRNAVPEHGGLLKSIPSVKAAMFALLPPGSKLNPHRDPFAGSLRYHLGLITPNSPDCRIFVDGEEHAWGDGKDVVFDETYVHWAENTTDQTRVILFADVERPLRTRWMSAINHRVGAFMGKITASPNTDTDTEKTGFINRLFALSQRKAGDSSNSFKSRFKSRHKKLDTRILDDLASRKAVGAAGFYFAAKREDPA